MILTLTCTEILSGFGNWYWSYGRCPRVIWKQLQWCVKKPCKNGWWGSNSDWADWGSTLGVSNMPQRTWSCLVALICYACHTLPTSLIDFHPTLWQSNMATKRQHSWWVKHLQTGCFSWLRNDWRSRSQPAFSWVSLDVHPDWKDKLASRVHADRICIKKSISSGQEGSQELGLAILPMYSLFNWEPRSYWEFPDHLLVRNICLTWLTTTSGLLRF